MSLHLLSVRETGTQLTQNKKLLRIPGRMQIDKNVAARFINHAISSKKARIDPDYTSTGEDQDAEMGGVGGSGTHTRFDQDEQDDFNEEEEEEAIEKNEEVERLLDDDKEEEEDLPAVEEEEISSSKKKGKRKILDPFAGKCLSICLCVSRRKVIRILIKARPSL